MELSIEDKLVNIIEITQGNICYRCLGRNFSKNIEDIGNLERGKYLRNKLEESNQNIPKTDTCYICNDLFTDLDKMIK